MLRYLLIFLQKVAIKFIDFEQFAPVFARGGAKRKPKYH